MKRSSYSNFVASLMGAALLALPPVASAQRCDDRTTGGGWILTDGVPTANFGFSGGIFKGELWGNLNYVDAEADLHIVSTAITSYELDLADSDCRLIIYAVEFNGESGFSAELHVCDHGEPGTEDFFQITVVADAAPSVVVYTAGDPLGGGNIQLHVSDCK